MESAIPEHLRVTRTRHPRVTDDYRPAYPSFVARHSPRVRRLVMAYLGAQGAPAVDPGLSAALVEPDGPRHWDRAVEQDPAGGGDPDVVTAAYWDDPAAFGRWFDRHREPWLAGTGGGRWVEVIRPTAHRYETIFGGRGRPEGVAVLAERFSGEVREHGYWGAMRDRMPAAQHDELHDPGELVVSQDGGSTRVYPAGSVCVIRSGQDWADTSVEERQVYLGQVEPNLRAGMGFLRVEGRAVGCFANRYLSVLDSAGRPTERSYGLGWWRSMAELERWSESHPTHLAIFGAFGRLVRAQGGRTKLRLYHEVAVAEPDEQWFEYANCRPGTGLLGAVAARG
jgi:aliphatic aldoxime dehydratase